MRSKRYFSMIIALAVFAIMSNYAFASTWYVDQATGNDANNGTTQALAKKTIQAMVGTASVINGDIVIVGDGTYIEQVRVLNKGITLKSVNGAASTTIKAPTYLSLTSYTEAGNLAWNDAIQGAGNALPSDVVMPVLFLDCPNTGYTNNVYGFTIDGDNQAQIAPAAGAEKSLVGILVKYTAGTISGNGTNQACIIKNCQTNGATPWANNDRNGYGVMVIGNSNCTIQYCTITTYQSAGIAVIGKNTTAGAATQNPIPNIFDNSIRGTDANPTSVVRSNTGWYAGILVSYGGRGTIRRNIISDHYNGMGTNAATDVTGVGAGIYLIDLRTITVGSTSVKTDGNVCANNEYGLMVNVTNGAIPTSSLTIQRNNFVYNGDVVTDRRQLVRFVNSGTAASSTLNMNNNAYGNSEGNSGFTPLLYTEGLAASDAFIADESGGWNDHITYTSILAPTSVDVNCTYTLYNTGVEWGYTKVNTIQRGVNAVATGFNNFVKVADCATDFQENVLIQKTLKLVGDSVATCTNRPTLNPTSGYAVTIQSPAAGPAVDEVVVNGFHFLQAGAQNAGLLVVGVDNNDNVNNFPPTGTQLRNNCWEGYGAQAADGGAFVGPNAAAVATSSVPWGGAYHSYNLGGAPQPSDVDAQSNNNFNYNGVSTVPTLKVWEVADDANDARILFNNLIIVHCGESINTAVTAVSSGGTIYIEGNCVYTEDVAVDKAITFRTIYDGLPLPKYPPVIQGINSPLTFTNAAAGSACGTTFATGSMDIDSIYFWNPNTITTALPGVYTTNDGAALATGQFFVGGFKGLRRPTQLHVIYGMGDGGCIQDAVNLIYNNCELNLGAAAAQVPATSGIIHIETGTYVQNVTVGKSLTFNSSNGSPVLGAGQFITLNNAPANLSATDCQTVVSSTLNGGAVRFQAPQVFVNADQTDVPTNGDWGTVDMGILLVSQVPATNPNVVLNAAGTFTNNRPTINKNNVTLNTSIAATKRTVDAITLNGSGTCGANASDIVDILVDSVFMATNVDCIQTALGNTNGNQDDEGVGNAVSGGNRQGTVAFTYGGATNVAQTLTVDKDVRFSGNVTPNTNSGSLTMRLGAQGTQIAGSTNFCNSIVNVTQRTGSTFSQIPDIQDGITLGCSGGTVNVGDGAAVGSASTWGGAGDTYNRDNTINKSLVVQGLNTGSVCANDLAYVINTAAGAWGTEGTRSAFTSTFTGFTAAAPIFSIASGVSTVTVQGFDFTSITNGAASAIIYAPGTGVNVSNTVTIKSNVYTGSSEQFIKTDASGTVATYHATWNIDCNRMVPGAVALGGNPIDLSDHTGTTYNRNLFDGAASSGSSNGITFRGLGGPTANIIQRSVFLSNPGGSTLWVGDLSATNVVGNVTITQNRMRSANTNGLILQDAANFTNTVLVTNNFIENNTTGVNLGSTAITHQFISVNNNSITNNTTGLTYTGNTATSCGINARGNWWNNTSGPTNTYNPMNVTPGTASAFGDPVSNNGVWGTDPTRISYIPWWTLATDAAAGTDGWQQPTATNAIGRVTRTVGATGAWIASYTTINAAASAVAGANERIIIMQGMPHWSPNPGPAGSSAWGAYFSEYVTGLTNFTGVEFRGIANSEYNCTASALQTSVTYIAGTDNITNPVPTTIGAAITPSTGVVTGSTGNGNAFEILTTRTGTTVRNLRIQGYSSTTPSVNPPRGAGIMATQTSGLTVDGVWVEGSKIAGTANGSYGIALDRVTGALLASNKFGVNTDISSTAGGAGGVAILAVDASNAAAAGAATTNTIGQNAATAIGSALGYLNGNNLISNTERSGVQIGGDASGNYTAAADGGAVTSLIQFNSFNGVRDAKGTGGASALAALYLNPSTGANGSVVTVNNNTIGGKGLPTTPTSDNKLDILVGQAGFTFSGLNNTIRDSGQVVDGINYTVTDEAGTRGAILRTFFNPASGNTFSHAAILTTDGTAPYNFTTQMLRNQPVIAIGTPTRIYRQIATPLANTATTYGAGSETYTNIIQVRENAGWSISELDQYFAENLSFVTTTGRVHQTILGPAVATVALDATSAHIISSTGPGTGTAITANGAENKYLRGNIVLHAIGSGLYGSINTGAANKGDVYLQRSASGTDAGLVQFAYHASTFGSQALISGIGTEPTSPNLNANKTSLIKAGLDDANDDIAYVANSNQDRRTGVFQAGNGTAFTKPNEPVAGLGVDGLTAFPNPANGGNVTVQFSVPTEAMVRIALYDALGRKVTDLKEGSLSMGVYDASFDVNNLPSGTYTVRMEYDYSVKTVQVHVIK